MAADAAGLLRRFATHEDVPGAAAAIFDRSGTTHCFATGRAGSDPAAPAATPLSTFQLNSVSKFLTGTAVAELVDRGRLSLDEPLRALLAPNEPAARRLGDANLRHVLSHTAGLASRAPGPPGLGGDSAGEYVARGLRLPLLAAPGTVYSYGDLSITLAGHVIERVTGVHFEQVMHDLLFEPLAMRTTHYPPLDSGPVPGRGLNASVLTYSSIRDLARLGVWHLRKAALGPERSAIPAMFRPHADIGLDIDLTYGLAAYIGPRYGSSVCYGHEGYGSGLWSKICLIPERGIGLAWVDWRGPDPVRLPERYEIIDQILSRLCGEKSWERRGGEALPPVPPTALGGEYRRLVGRPLEVAPDGDGVLISGARGVRLRMHPTREGRFVAPRDVPLPRHPPWEPHAGSSRCCAMFVRDQEGRLSYLLLNGFAFRRVDDVGH